MQVDGRWSNQRAPLLECGMGVQIAALPVDCDVIF